MSEEKKNEVLKQDVELDEAELDGVAGGSVGAANPVGMNNFAANFKAKDDGKIGAPMSKIYSGK